MKESVWTLLLLVVLPGAALSGSSTYFLFPDWAMLTVSHQNYQRLAASPAFTVSDLVRCFTDTARVAEAADNRHRINCFAEGVGALLGGILLSIGVHGICTLSTQPYRSILISAQSAFKSQPTYANCSVY